MSFAAIVVWAAILWLRSYADCWASKWGELLLWGFELLCDRWLAKKVIQDYQAPYRSRFDLARQPGSLQLNFEQAKILTFRIGRTVTFHQERTILRYCRPLIVYRHERYHSAAVFRNEWLALPTPRDSINAHSFLNRRCLLVGCVLSANKLIVHARIFMHLVICICS